VNHDDVRESISASLDGEQGTLSAAAVEDHLRTCADCRAWSASVLAAAQRSQGAAQLGTAQPPPGLTEQVLRAVSADLTAAGRTRREERLLRVGLVAVGAVQLVLAVPVLIFGHDHAAPLHVAHELGSFDAAVAIGLVAAARRPRLAAGMLPLIGAITGLLLITAGSDLAAGRTDVIDEAPHLLDLVGFLLLRRLSVGTLPGPTGPPALLVPISSGPKPSIGGSLRMSMTALHVAGAHLRVAAAQSLRAAGHGLGTGLRRVVVVLGSAVLLVTGFAGPASAHVVHNGDDPTNWRTTVSGVTPAVPDLSVTSAEAGQRIGVTYRGAGSVIVLGFTEEPFLRLAGGVVEANLRSATGHEVMPGLPAAPAAEPAGPVWRVIARATTWWWHDPRTHYDGLTLPLQVQSNTGQFVHYADWRIGLVADGRPAAVTGSLDWVPARTSSLPWVLGGGLLLVCAGVGWLRRWSRPLIAAIALLTAADMLHAGSAAGARVGSLENHLAALPGHGAIIAVVWLLAGATCVAAWRRRSAAAYLGLLVGAVTVMVDALPSAGVLWRSQAVTTLGHDQAASLVAGIIGAGIGICVSCFVLMIRLDPAPAKGRTILAVAPAQEDPDSTAALPATNG
jgi:predicted anti-sigma-YlaC factor YlaD